MSSTRPPGRSVDPSFVVFGDGVVGSGRDLRAVASVVAPVGPGGEAWLSGRTLPPAVEASAFESPVGRFRAWEGRAVNLPSAALAVFAVVDLWSPLGGADADTAVAPGDASPPVPFSPAPVEVGAVLRFSQRDWIDPLAAEVEPLMASPIRDAP